MSSLELASLARTTLRRFNIAFISIVAALLITMIAISIEHPGKGVDATVETNLYNGFLAVTNIVFAYGESGSTDDRTYSLLIHL